MPDRSSSEPSTEKSQLEFRAVLNVVRDARNVKYMRTLVVPKDVAHI